MLYFVTGNAGKFREVKLILPELEQLKLDLDEIQSLDPQAVIEHKLEQAAQMHDGEFIVEDVSMVFNCIKPLPGTLIKWFELGVGVPAMADLVSRYDDHTAACTITIGYRDRQGVNHFFSAQYTGRIDSPRGENGFGFDAIFIADGQTKRNAELTPDQKNAFSARGVATRALAAYLAAHH